MTLVNFASLETYGFGHIVAEATAQLFSIFLGIRWY
jgi:hypothetical protein